MRLLDSFQDAQANHKAAVFHTRASRISVVGQHRCDVFLIQGGANGRKQSARGAPSTQIQVVSVRRERQKKQRWRVSL
ncbi:hypothetical protein A3J56_02860 [Candidatus Giovannonibacteria bacterium RIFCSPHIGHO2_02_FULL_46_20]|uniref:Uncharacterized protein n=1 Tax=Candidatus Giovannonibacteria bacterium RIFCSPHIGHO2_02_FULL_46_20 TaxID=1798338 RepID=A0A1F5WFK8_9BACT|nr:MAG: hypothetical protein A3J56_02860 [Candidatus Giovannonibacteria bacterium RIFCSPHIGHO2_02_FULL_46_20]